MLNCPHPPPRCFFKILVQQGAGELSHVKTDKLKDCEKHPLSGNACSTPSCLGKREFKQKQMLEDYARRNRYTDTVPFTDDGISGIRFNRPGFMAMMKEVYNGNVDTIIIVNVNIKMNKKGAFQG